MSTDQANTLADEILNTMRRIGPEPASKLMEDRWQDIDFIRKHEPVRIIHMRNMIRFMEAAGDETDDEKKAKREAHDAKYCSRCVHILPCPYAKSTACGPTYMFTEDKR